MSVIKSPGCILHLFSPQSPALQLCTGHWSSRSPVWALMVTGHILNSFTEFVSNPCYKTPRQFHCVLWVLLCVAFIHILTACVFIFYLDAHSSASSSLSLGLFFLWLLGPSLHTTVVTFLCRLNVAQRLRLRIAYGAAKGSFSSLDLYGSKPTACQWEHGESLSAFSLSFQAPGREASTHQLSSLMAFGSLEGTQVKLMFTWGGTQNTEVPALSNPLLCSSFPQNKTHHTTYCARIPEEPKLPQNRLESGMNKTQVVPSNLGFYPE